MNRMTNMVDGVGTTKYTYSAAGQLLTEDGPFASDTVTNVYSNRLRTGLGLQQPIGAWTNGFAYDSVKRLTSVTSPAGAFGYVYESGLFTHHPSLIALPNTSYITNAFDADARLIATYLKNSGNTVLDSYTYIYNPANQRTNLARADSSTVAFKYDGIGQLKVADSSVNTEDRGYVYDTAWNLNNRTNNGTLGSFYVNIKNEITNAGGFLITNDLNGNITNFGGYLVYTYDDENRLTQLSDTVYHSYQTAFVYDGLGRRRKRLEYIWSTLKTPHWVLNNEVWYIYDGWRLIQERDGSNNPLVSYTRGNDLSGSMEGAGGIGGLLARSDGYSGGNFTTHNYYFADGNGNVTYMLDGSQSMVASYRYDPFGNLISSSGTLRTANLYRFSSKEIDFNSGMYYYGYRFYDPNLQRWINRDPTEQRAGRSTKKSLRAQAQAGWNLYQFCGGDGVNQGDSDGRYTITHWISDKSKNFGFGGKCCNTGVNTEWWLDDGVWKQLPPGKCTGFTDDCDGMTCEGSFHAIGFDGNAHCNGNTCTTWVPVGPSSAAVPIPGWTPGDGIHTSPFDRGLKQDAPLPPGYPWNM